MSSFSIDEAFKSIAEDVVSLLALSPVKLGLAKPQNVSGVYMLIVNNLIVYVGEAKGSKGLRDRLLNKHISGDHNHAVQRAFKDEFPDRLRRRDHIKEAVTARWLPISDLARVSVVERFLIWMYQPTWNLK